MNRGLRMEIEKTREQLHEEDLQRIRGFRLIDDDFLNVCFADNIEATELLVHIILNKPDLVVSRVQTQKTIKNIHGRSLRLDIDATDTESREYNIEVQRSDSGANPKRARYHGSLLDANIVEPGEKFEHIPETFVIFITENDIFGLGKPIYKADRYYEGEDGNMIPLNDGLHILYVNGAYKGNDDIGKLMHDFFYVEPDDMYFEKLAERARYFKKDEGGIRQMCKVMEDMRNESIMQERKKFAKRLIEDGENSAERIARLSELALEDVEELLENKTA